MKLLDFKVFPSDQKTISVSDDDIYGGAHNYSIQNSVGFNNGQADYVDSFQSIDFVKKDDDGNMNPGVQSEQLAFILLDRAKKLNARFPSSYNEQMIKGLEMFLDACEARVQDRIYRGVMGQLKK